MSLEENKNSKKIKTLMFPLIVAILLLILIFYMAFKINSSLGG